LGRGRGCRREDVGKKSRSREDHARLKKQKLGKKHKKIKQRITIARKSVEWGRKKKMGRK